MINFFDCFQSKKNRNDISSVLSICLLSVTFWSYFDGHLTVNDNCFSSKSNNNCYWFMCNLKIDNVSAPNVFISWYVMSILSEGSKIDTTESAREKESTILLIFNKVFNFVLNFTPFFFSPHSCKLWLP